MTFKVLYKVVRKERNKLFVDVTIIYIEKKTKESTDKLLVWVQWSARVLNKY